MGRTMGRTIGRTMGRGTWDVGRGTWDVGRGTSPFLAHDEKKRERLMSLERPVPQEKSCVPGDRKKNEDVPVGRGRDVP